MGLMDRAIEALRAIPEEEQEAIALAVLDLVDRDQGRRETALTMEQLAEIRRRDAQDEPPGDLAELERIRAKFGG